MSEVKSSLVLFLLLTVITGVVYPSLVTGIAALAFADEASGSLIESDGHIVRSHLLGQSFSSPRYFWSRPSATAPYPYNGTASSGSNQGPTSPALEAGVRERIGALRAMDPDNLRAVPIDLVTASGSGLDPHISLAAAEYQIARVARARGLSEDAVRAMVSKATRGRTLGILGEARVNVLELNLALEQHTAR